MDVYFLRHANAGEARLDPTKDEKRPLDKLGIAQSHNMGRALAALDVTVDANISIPLRRATQTATVVANEIGYEEKVVLDAALRSQATYEEFQELLRRHSRKEAILVVGHNPSMTEFVNKLLAGEAASPVIEMKKGAIAKIEVGRRQAILKWYVPPKVVGSIQQASASNSRPKTVSK